MTYHTHAYLGAILHPVICETWNVRLSRKRFIAGSVKPDRSSLFVRHPHFWGHSRAFVVRRIRKLSRRRLDPAKKNKRFSEDLGIVLHYVADFFTAAHNVRPNRLREHIAYEAALHEEFLAGVSAASVRNTLRLLGPTPSRAGASAETLLWELHARYSPSMAHPSADVREILLACLQVTSFIMEGAAADIGTDSQAFGAQSGATGP